MSVGGNRSPYRSPCGYEADAPEFYWLGAPWQHYDPGEADVQVYMNTTVVTNYADPSSPGFTSTIQPYVQYAFGFYGPEGTLGNRCGDTGAPDWEPPCGPWSDPPFPGYTGNTYAAFSPEQTQSVATCRKIGFKYIVARKIWQGRFGFVHSDGCCDYSGPQPAASSTPANTKYLTLTWDCTATIGSASGATIATSNYTIQGTCSIDRYTGLMIATGVVFAVTESIVGGDTTTSTPDDGIADAILAACGKFCQNTFCVDPDGSGCGMGSVSNVTEGSGSYNYPAGDGTQLQDDIATANTQTNGLGGALSISVSDTSYVRTYTGNTDITGAVYTNYSISATLSDPYTNDDLNSDVDAMLAEWDLADDVQLPWRQDNNCTSGPLVTYLEYANSPEPQETDITDDSAIAVTLAAYGVDQLLLGAPNPVPVVAGLGSPASYGIFDFRAVNFETIDLDGGGSCNEVTSYGQYAPSWAGPFATQWTNDLDAAAYFPGYFAAYSSLTIGADFCNAGNQYLGGALHKSKYAEIVLLGAPSHNFARPCGDKDAATVGGVGDPSAPTCDEDFDYISHGSYRWSGLDDPCTASGWLDNYPKGNWCLLSWTFGFRDNFTDADDPNYRPVTGAWSGLDVLPGCSKFVPCCPAIIYLTNNGESSANSQTFTNAALTCDECYGALNNVVVKQWMQDPFWQVPVRPCDLDSGTEWLEDDGTGNSTGTDPVTLNDIQYYPQRPYEECLTEVPMGAPALPAGYYINVLDVAAINSGATDGLILYPLGAGVCFMTPWIWAINRYNAIQSDADFACIYADPMAVCDNDPTLLDYYA